MVALPKKQWQPGQNEGISKMKRYLKGRIIKTWWLTGKEGRVKAEEGLRMILALLDNDSVN